MLIMKLKGLFELFDVKSFPKDESYPSFKQPRAINSRSDAFKALIGPYIKDIEDEMYKNPWFIKHVPVRDRPKYLQDMLGGADGQLVDSDWTSMEAQVKAEIMDACELQMFDYFTQTLPEAPLIQAIFREAKSGQNKCEFKNVTVYVEAKRMSGEMDTSLSNGFLNMMEAKFSARLMGSRIKGCVEGDDGIFRINGLVPPRGILEQLGMDIKMNKVDELSKASFCGCIYTEEDSLIATDPVVAGLDLFWGPGKLSHSSIAKKKTYLRAKALSMAHQYPGCPLLGKLSQWALHHTKGHDVRSLLNQSGMCAYDKDVLREAMKHKYSDLYREPTSAMRLLVQEHYGISVFDQHRIEDSIVFGAKLPESLLTDYANTDQKDYYDRYVIPVMLDYSLDVQF